MFADGVGGSRSSKTKFRLAGGAQPLILLPVQVNGAGPFQFILDTGAGTCLLSPGLAARLGIESTGAKEGQTAGGRVAVALAKVDSLAVGSTTLSGVDVGIVDLSHIGRTVGAQIDGDLGYNFFKHFRMTIDYRTNEVALVDPKGIDYTGTLALTEVSIRLAGPAKPLILVDTYINGSGPFQFAIDTGTSTTAIAPELAEKFRVDSRSTGAVTTGGVEVELRAGILPVLQVGGARIENVAVVIGPFLAMVSQAAGAQLDGIIGYNFLRNYKVAVDYPNLTLSLFSA